MPNKFPKPFTYFTFCKFEITNKLKKVKNINKWLSYILLISSDSLINKELEKSSDLIRTIGHFKIFGKTLKISQ